MTHTVQKHSQILDQWIFNAMLEHSGNDLLYIKKFARSGELSAGTEEDIWSQGGKLSYLTSEETMSVVSSNSNDIDITGTGARKITIKGLDENYDPVSETINMNGITPVITVKKFLRIYRVVVIDAGILEANIGNITLTATTSLTVQALIGLNVSKDHGTGITHMSHFTVPNGYTAMLLEAYLSTYKLSGSGTKNAEVQIHERQLVKGTTDRWIDLELDQFGMSNLGSSPVIIDGSMKRSFPPKTDLRFTVYPESNKVTVSVHYNLLLIKQDYIKNTFIQ